MALLYDLLTLIVFLLFFLVGLKRGFLKSVLSLVCFIVAVIASLFLASALAEPIYNACFKDKVTDFIEENIDDIDVADIVNDNLLKNVGLAADSSTIESIIGTTGEIGDNIKSYAEQNGIDIDEDAVSQNLKSFLQSSELTSAITEALPSDFADALFSAVQSSADTVEKVLQACVDPDKENAAEVIEDAFVNDILILLIKCALFFLLFVVLSFVFKLIIAATGLVNKIPVAGKLNRVLGGVFGMLKGGVALVIIAIIVAAAVSVLGTKYSLVSESTVNNSLVFKYFYSLVA